MGKEVSLKTFYYDFSFSFSPRLKQWNQFVAMLAECLRIQFTNLLWYRVFYKNTSFRIICRQYSCLVRIVNSVANRTCLILALTCLLLASTCLLLDCTCLLADYMFTTGHTKIPHCQEKPAP